MTDSPPQTIGASFFLKQWGPYNVAIWVKLKILIFDMLTYFLVFDNEIVEIHQWIFLFSYITGELISHVVYLCWANTTYGQNLTI